MKYTLYSALVVCLFTQCKTIKINQEKKENIKIYMSAKRYTDTCFKSFAVSVVDQNITFNLKDTTFTLNPYTDLDSIYCEKALKAYLKIYPENKSNQYVRKHFIKFSILGPNYAISLKYPLIRLAPWKAYKYADSVDWGIYMRASKFMDSLKSTTITMRTVEKNIIFKCETPLKRILNSANFQTSVINDIARRAYKAIYEHYGFDYDFLDSHVIVFNMYWLKDPSHYYSYEYLLSNFRFSKLSPTLNNSIDDN